MIQSLKSDNNRIKVLDSVRGLASLQVLIHHCLIMTIPFFKTVINIKLHPNDKLFNLISFTPFHFFWAGHEAVILFFVLSGFVLSIPFFKDDRKKYKEYFIKRIFRIYGPYFVSLSVGIFLNYIFNTHPRINLLSDWFNGIWIESVSVKKIFLFFALQGDYNNVVTSLWTIPIEIKISLLFPFVVRILKERNIKTCVFILFGNIVFYTIGSRIGVKAYFPDFNLLFYLSFFMSGAILYKYKSIILPFVDNINNFFFSLIFIIAISLYTYQWYIQFLPLLIKNTFVLNLSNYIKLHINDYLICISSLLLLMLAISKRASKLLLNRYLLFLGKISFSLYLTHPIILGLIGFTLSSILPVSFIIILSFIISLIVAIPFYYLVEKPFENLGRRLSKNVSPSFSKIGLEQKISSHPKTELI